MAELKSIKQLANYQKMPRRFLPDPLPAEYSGFINHLENLLQTESRRGQFIVLAEIGSTLLAEILSKSFCLDTQEEVRSDCLVGSNVTAPLSSFSARIKACYKLGYLSKPAFDAMNTLRELRNLAAHQYWHLEEDRLSGELDKLEEKLVLQTRLAVGKFWDNQDFSPKFGMCVIIILIRLLILKDFIAPNKLHSKAP